MRWVIDRVGQRHAIYHSNHGHGHTVETLRGRTFLGYPYLNFCRLGANTGYCRDAVVYHLYRNAVGGQYTFRAVTRQSHDPCGRHCDGVLKVLAYLNRTSEYGLTPIQERHVLSMYCASDCAEKRTYRYSVSGIEVLYGECGSVSN